MNEVEESLRRLRTDYIDLYQMHRFDPDTPLEETLRALDDLVHARKVRYIGSSNYASWQIMESIAISEREGFVSFVSDQPGYSLADRTVERDLIPFAEAHRVGIIPFFPLAGGLLTGKYSGGSVPAGSQLEKNPRFAERMDKDRVALGDFVLKLAEELGTSATALSLAWLMHRPAVATVIAGATREAQIDENAKAVDLKLSNATIEALDQASEEFVYAAPFGSPPRTKK